MKLDHLRVLYRLYLVDITWWIHSILATQRLGPAGHWTHSIFWSAAVAGGREVAGYLDRLPDETTDLMGTPGTTKAKGFAAGMSYGLAAVVLSHPVDTIKTRQQISGRYGFQSTLTTLLWREGASGLLKGFSPAAASSVLFRAVPFTVYSWSSDMLAASSDWLACHHITLAVAAGCCAGAARSVLECPMEVAKVRWQVDQNMHQRAVFTGLTVTMARNMSMIGIFWGLWEASKKDRERICGSSKTANSFLGGAGCSAVAWMCVFPIDVIKSRCQSIAVGSTHVSWLEVGSQVVRQQGVRGLYAGLPAGILRTLIANGGAMVVYDSVLRWLEATPPRNLGDV